jgi:hypothetical protein
MFRVLFNRLFGRRSHAADVLAQYRAAIETGDHAAAARRKQEFARYSSRVRRHAVDAVYFDVLPSRRGRFAFNGEAALVSMVADDRPKNVTPLASRPTCGWAEAEV